MSHTKEQEQIVTQVLSCLPTKFYDILLVSKTADSTTIKRSYRKLAVRLHPDKNPHPRAAEAFKILSKAWEVLGDQDQKRIYDQTGQDPISRSLALGLGFAQQFASGFGVRPGGQAGFEEDIFSMFFGGGASRMSDQMPGFAFNSQGFSFQSFGADPFTRRPHPRHQQTAQEPHNLKETVRLLLPLLFVIAVPILLGLFSSSDPEYLLLPSSKFSVEQKTPGYKISYYVSGDYAADHGNDYRHFRKLGRRVERDYIQDMRQRCSQEQMERQRMIEDSYGWFFTDEDKLRKARLMNIPSCSILESMNLL